VGGRRGKGGQGRSTSLTKKVHGRGRKGGEIEGRELKQQCSKKTSATFHLRDSLRGSRKRGLQVREGLGEKGTKRGRTLLNVQTEGQSVKN